MIIFEKVLNSLQYCEHGINKDIKHILCSHGTGKNTFKLGEHL